MADTLTREEIEAVRDYAEMRRDDAWKDVLALCDTALKLMDQQDAWVAEGITAGKETIRKLTEARDHLKRTVVPAREERDAYVYAYGALDRPRIKKLTELEEELAEAKTDLELSEAGKERLALSYSAATLERDKWHRRANQMAGKFEDRKAERDRWLEVVSTAGVEFEDERVKYVTVQIGRQDWLDARATLEADK